MLTNYSFEKTYKMDYNKLKKNKNLNFLKNYKKF